MPNLLDHLKSHVPFLSSVSLCLLLKAHYFIIHVLYANVWNHCGYAFAICHFSGSLIALFPYVILSFFFQSVNSFLPTSPSQNIIWENFLKPGLQVSSCREDLFPVAISLGHNQPRLQLKTEFSTWGFSNHPYSVISSHKLYEGIWAYGLLCENISLPFRIRNEDSQCPLPFPGAFSHFILTLRI